METTISTLFFLLGFLDEYGGRVIAEGDDCIEIFYASERAEAEIFKKFLEKLSAERSVRTKIVTEIDPDGGHITFRCRELSELINSFYKEWSTMGYRIEENTGEQRLLRVAQISKAVFSSVEKNEKLSFLLGAYCRSGEGDQFRFTNAKHKADLVAELLEECGCTDIRVTLDNPGYVPAVFSVRFAPSVDIQHWLAHNKTRMHQGF